MLSQKKEQFELSLQKQRREEVFKLKRQSLNQEIPFSEVNSNENDQYYQAYTQSLNYLENQSGMQFENDIVITIAYISHLNKSLEQCECDPQYDNVEDIEKVFLVFNKGYPVIDKACLNILREFTLYNHALCQPILQHIPEIIEYFVISKYNELKSIAMNIFGNLAADCQICRDRILIYDVPKILHEHIGSQEKELREDYLTLLININNVKPDLANQYYIQLSPIIHFCYQHNLESSISIRLLNFIKKCYSKDKTLINLDFITILIKHQPNQDELNIILQILAQYSTQSREQSQALSLAIIPYILTILKNAAGIATIPKSITKNIQTACIILYNLALDGIQLADQIFQQGLSEILITYLYKFGSIVEFNSLIFILLSSCSQNQMDLINRNAQLMKLIIRNFNVAIMNDENIKSNLDILLVIMHRDNQTINVFIEENGENLISSLQRHHDQEISDICDRIFALLDNE